MIRVRLLLCFIEPRVRKIGVTGHRTFEKNLPLPDPTTRNCTLAVHERVNSLFLVLPGSLCIFTESLGSNILVKSDLEVNLFIKLRKTLYHCSWSYHIRIWGNKYFLERHYDLTLNGCLTARSSNMNRGAAASVIHGKVQGGFMHGFKFDVDICKQAFDYYDTVYTKLIDAAFLCKK